MAANPKENACIELSNWVKLNYDLSKLETKDKLMSFGLYFLVHSKISILPISITLQGDPPYYLWAYLSLYITNTQSKSGLELLRRGLECWCENSTNSM